MAVILVGLAAVRAQPGGAEATSVRLDPQTTRIDFTLGATLHAVHGTARLERGRVCFDLATGAASGEVWVSAVSAETGRRGRDEDMHRKVLDSARYPWFVLRPKAISGDLRPGEPSDVRLAATLEIQERPHPIDVQVRTELSETAVAARARFVVPYVEWGLPDPSKLLLRVEKRVEVEVDAHGELEGPEHCPTRP